MILIVRFVKKNHLCIAGEICKGVRIFANRNMLQELFKSQRARTTLEISDFIKHSLRRNEKGVFTHFDNYDSDILVFSILSKK